MGTTTTIVFHLLLRVLVCWLFSFHIRAYHVGMTMDRGYIVAKLFAVAAIMYLEPFIENYLIN